MTIWNQRRHIDKNVIPNHLKTMTKRLLDGTDSTEVCLWECDRFTLIGKLICESRKFKYYIGPRSNIRKMHRRSVGGDGQFDLKDTVRVLNGVETKFGQVYVLSSKDEELEDEESYTRCEPLFVALMKDRKKESYDSFLKKESYRMYVLHWGTHTNYC